MVSTGSQCALCVVLYLYTILSVKVMAMAEIRKQKAGGWYTATSFAFQRYWPH